MPPGEILVTCPHCQHRTSVPFAAVKRDNFYCSSCFQKVPMEGMRSLAHNAATTGAPRPPKKSSRGYRR